MMRRLVAVLVAASMTVSACTSPVGVEMSYTEITPPSEVFTSVPAGTFWMFQDAAGEPVFLAPGTPVMFGGFNQTVMQFDNDDADFLSLNPHLSEWANGNPVVAPTATPVPTPTPVPEPLKVVLIPATASDLAASGSDAAGTAVSVNPVAWSGLTPDDAGVMLTGLDAALMLYGVVVAQSSASKIWSRLTGR